MKAIAAQAATPLGVFTNARTIDAIQVGGVWLSVGNAGELTQLLCTTGREETLVSFTLTESAARDLGLALCSV